MPDGQPRLQDIHLVVGKLEAHALMVDQRLAEGHAFTRISGGNVMRPPRGTQPAHAVGQTRRGQADLRIAKALADLPQHRVAIDAQIVDIDLCMAAGEAGIQRVEHPHDLHRRVRQRRHEHGGTDVLALLVHRVCHDDADGGALGPGDQPLPAGDAPSVAVRPCHRLHGGGVGTGTG